MKAPKSLLFALILAAIAVGAFFVLQNKTGNSESKPTPVMGAEGIQNETFEVEGSVVKSDSSTTGKVSSTPDLTVDAHGLSKAVAVIRTDKGVIKFRFYPQDAPNTVRRIITLINEGFYNGIAFHRVVPGFVVQGGDPRGDGSGGSGMKLKAEFNKRRHLEGTVAMARTPDPDSADSQFYIALSALPQLDEKYTVFGQVVEGMEIVRQIQIGDKMLQAVIE